MLGIRAFLAEIQTGRALRIVEIGGQFYPISLSLASIETQFRSVSHTTNTTTAVVTPSAGNAIVLTDLLLSGEKINGGTVTVQFTDGTQTVVIFKAHVTDGPVNFAIPFQGRWRGWKNARIDFVTDTANQDATCSIGYGNIGNIEVLEFAEWDALRG